MTFVFLTSFCGASVSPLAAKPKKTRPNDLAAFFHDADICQYLSGEWDNTLPQKRKNELSREMNKTCFDLYKRQERLKKKYQGNKSIMQKLESYGF